MSDVPKIRLNVGRYERKEKTRSPYRTPGEDFHKVLKKERKEHRDPKKKESLAEEKKAKRAKKSPVKSEQKETVSLFDLPKEMAKKTKSVEEEVNVEEVPEETEFEEEIKQESLSALKTQLTKKQERTSSTFAQEQPDLSYVNPIATDQANIAQVSSQETASTRISELQEIVEKLIDKLYIAQQEGKTDTTIILKNLPRFENVQLTVTEFDSAKGEFNIKFENLTQEAKQVLDANQDSLRLALDKKGYTIHIITTTTQPTETITEVKEETLAKDQGDQKDEQPKEKDEEEREA